MTNDLMISIILQNSNLIEETFTEPSIYSTEIIALVIAFIAVIFAPFVQYLIAKKQINSQVLSANRQDWINTLRESISNFKANFTLYAAHLEMNSGRDNPEIVNKLGLQSNLYREKIKLLINPNEPDHENLVKEIEGLLGGIEILTAGSREEKAQIKKEINEGLEKITSISQVILKSEWNRVKKLK